MTMHIYFNKDHDGYKKGFSGYVERSLARRFCENEIAMPYKKYMEAIEKIEFDAKAKKAADKLARDEKNRIEKEEDEKKKRELLGKKDKKERPVSKKFKSREKETI